MTVNFRNQDAVCKTCQKPFTFYSGNRRGKYCSPFCSEEASRIKKIQRFLDGLLTDRGVRSKTIRNYLTEQQKGCDVCGCPPIHCEAPLIFIVDHIDGDWTNNLPDNIRAICPNCNSQTETFGGRNVGKHNNGHRVRGATVSAVHS